jgi:hypothetical protein
MILNLIIAYIKTHSALKMLNRLTGSQYEFYVNRIFIKIYWYCAIVNDFAVDTY